MTWIEDVRAKEHAATPGPWGADAEQVRWGGLPAIRHAVTAPGDTVIADVLEGGQRDTEFIAWARNVMPAMLDALEAAEAVVSPAIEDRLTGYGVRVANLDAALSIVRDLTETNDA